jgi:tRNA (guanine37-N1)-methyltransferase
MRFHVITLFPDLIESAASFGVVGQALKEGVISVSSLSPRAFTSNVHQTVDDRPFGGGDGMIMMAEPAAQAMESVLSRAGREEGRRKVIHFSPRGTKFDDAKARELAGFDELVLVASRYGGIDERFLSTHVDEEISVGDYVLSGGELPALIVIDAVSRLLPGVLGNEDSAEQESFGGDLGLLEHPQFTRPREWRGLGVPQALLSGDHARIVEWKSALSVLVTAERRPDLLVRVSPIAAKKALKTLEELNRNSELSLCGIEEESLVRERLVPIASAENSATKKGRS